MALRRPAPRLASASNLRLPQAGACERSLQPGRLRARGASRSPPTGVSLGPAICMPRPSFTEHCPMGACVPCVRHGLGSLGACAIKNLMLPWVPECRRPDLTVRSGSLLTAVASPSLQSTTRDSKRQSSWVLQGSCLD